MQRIRSGKAREYNCQADESLKKKNGTDIVDSEGVSLEYQNSVLD
jgi:hypothetical protein